MINAIILAAGLSKRMGSPKLVLPWDNTTVIGRVVDVLVQAGIREILVVTGGARRQVEAALKGLPVRTVFNPHYEQDHMLFSLQVGLASLPDSAEATLVALGDQPQVQLGVVRKVLQSYRDECAPLVVPSYRMRRGHPWLMKRSLWPGVLEMQPPHTMRDILVTFSDQICYVPVETDTILRDLDTFADYEREKPPG